MAVRELELKGVLSTNNCMRQGAKATKKGVYIRAQTILYACTIIIRKGNKLYILVETQALCHIDLMMTFSKWFND